MADVVAGNLIVNIKAMTGDFQRNMDNATKGLSGFSKNVANTQISLKKLTIAFTAFTAASGLVARSFIKAASEAEGYQVRLKVLLGSQSEGNRMFQEMTKYASKVPFTYREVMGAATSLSGVMRGGVDEIKEWMPLIGDLAAASGLDIQTTTSQVIKMYSAGAAAADMFRERGILAMLGFKAGVSYSAEETRKAMFEAWNKADSQFKGATDELSKTWTGLTSMLSDAWFQFKVDVMEAGLFDAIKEEILKLIEKINELKEAGKLEEWANKISGSFEKIISSFNDISLKIDVLIGRFLKLGYAIKNFGMFGGLGDPLSIKKINKYFEEVDQAVSEMMLERMGIRPYGGITPEEYQTSKTPIMFRKGFKGFETAGGGGEGGEGGEGTAFGIGGRRASMSSMLINESARISQIGLTGTELALNKTRNAWLEFTNEMTKPESGTISKFAESSMNIFREMGSEMRWELENISYFFTKDVLAGGWKYGFQELRNMATDALHHLAGRLVVTIERELIDRIYDALISEAVGKAVGEFIDLFKPVGNIFKWIWEGESGSGGLKSLFTADWFQEAIKAPFKNTADFFKWIWAGESGSGGLKSLFESDWLADTVKAPFKKTADMFKWIWEGESGSGGLKSLFESDWFKKYIANPFKEASKMALWIWHGSEFGSGIKELFEAGWFKKALKDPFDFLGKLGVLIWHGSEFGGGLLELFTADWFKDAILHPFKTLSKAGTWLWEGVAGIGGGIKALLEAEWLHTAIYVAFSNPIAAAFIATVAILSAAWSSLEDDIYEFIFGPWKSFNEELRRSNTGIVNPPTGENIPTGPTTGRATPLWVRNAFGEAFYTDLMNRIGSYQHGGIVPGRIGQPQLAVIHGGETITPPGIPSIVVNVTGNNILDDNTANMLAQRITEKISMQLRTRQRYSL